MAMPVNIDDLRRRARRRLPRVVFDYVDGGAEDETTLRRNREAFERISFRPRILAGGEIDTATTLFGEKIALPLVVAPTGLNGLLWPKGDVCLARAAGRANVGFALSTASNTSLEDIARHHSGPRWFQLYPWGGPDFSAHLLDRAAAAGYGAVILTVDSLVAGNRERDRRHGFAHQIQWSPRIVIDGLAHPRWLASVWLRFGTPRLENLAPLLRAGATAAEMAEFTRSQRNPSFDWSDIRRIRDQWKGPLLVKGVLTAEDAAIAHETGVDGVVVSNHGGRQLDGAISTIEALPSIVDEVGDKMSVLVDSGFRRGTDVVKALALGARAVLIGRAALYGLAASGEAGSSQALGILGEEIRRTMRLLGCREIAEISRDHLHFDKSKPLDL
ncbi:MAG: alpha-hydroxy-acid oxidizing enzyme [Ahrensia sp.]|nr:alpha-hydroxy-acid oxidizing enzyme [Ahrensia sp.]